MNGDEIHTAISFSVIFHSQEASGCQNYLICASATSNELRTSLELGLVH